MAFTSFHMQLAFAFSLQQGIYCAGCQPQAQGCQYPLNKQGKVPNLQSSLKPIAVYRIDDIGKEFGKEPSQ